MSAPETRLLGDAAAEKFELAALAHLATAPGCYREVEDLSLAVVALCRDRSARIELSAATHNSSR